MELGKLVVRGTVGTLFVGHGLQKLTGSFGGHGLEGTGQFFERVGLWPGRQHALASGLAETGGGALLLVGAATPAAVAAISGSMITAIRTVHWRNGPWAASNGYEYNAVLLATLFSLAESGPGRLSVDALRGRERQGTRWALAALGAGAAGSLLATWYGRRHAQPAPEDAAEPRLGDEVTHADQPDVSEATAQAAASPS